MHDPVTVLAQIFNSGKTSPAAIKLSQTLLNSYGNIEAILKISLSQLQKISHFKPQHWHNLLAYQQQQLLPLRRALRGKILQAHTSEVLQYCHKLFEYVHGGLRVIVLDRHHYYLNDLFIAVGDHKIDYNLYIRDFYLLALEHNAYGVILATNQIQECSSTPYFFEHYQKLRYDLKLIDIELHGVIDLKQQRINF